MDSKRRPFPIKDKFNVAIPNANVLETLNEFNDTIAEFNSVFSGGTSNQILKSNGSGTSPTWVSLQDLGIATNSGIDALASRVGINETAISGLNTTTTGLGTRVGINETAIDELSSTTTSLGTRVGTNETAIGALGGRVTALESSGETNTTAISGLKSKVDAFLDAEGIKNETLDTLKEIQDYIESDAAAAAELVSRVSTNEQDIETLDERVTTLENSNGGEQKGSPVYYGTCATGETTATKVVDCEGFILERGTTINVKFTYGSSATSPYLNVNNTGAIAIKSYGSTAGTLTYIWRPNGIATFTYDGTYWLLNRSVTDGQHYGLSKVDTLTLNNMVPSRPSFYAPTVSGSSGQILKSNGANQAPTWVDAPSGSSSENIGECIFTGSTRSYYLGTNFYKYSYLVIYYATGYKQATIFAGTSIYDSCSVYVYGGSESTYHTISINGGGTLTVKNGTTSLDIQQVYRFDVGYQMIGE